MLGGSTITKSSSEISARQEFDEHDNGLKDSVLGKQVKSGNDSTSVAVEKEESGARSTDLGTSVDSTEEQLSSSEMTKIAGTISYVEDDGIVMPSNMESSRPLVNQAVQVNISETLSSRQDQ